MSHSDKDVSKVLKGVLYSMLFAVSSLVSCGGGGTTTIDMPVTPPPPSDVESRTSGIAPLSVFFDKTGLTSSTTLKPFHELQYEWNFGDPSGSTVSGTKWAYGAHPGISSRNVATGGVAGHIYENSGTFTPSVTITDGNNTVTYTLPTITVYGQNDATNGFGSSSNTVCVYQTASNFTCPNGGTSHQQSNFVTAISTYAATGKQLLFQRGDTFTGSSMATIVLNGPGLIGAYGTGAKPIILNSGFNGAQLNFGAQDHPTSGTCSGCTVGELKDWRVMDLVFQGTSSAVFGGSMNQSGINENGQFNQLTFLRIDGSQQAQLFGNGGQNLDLFNYAGSGIHKIWDQLFIQDCTETSPFNDGVNTIAYGVYLAGERLFFSGNHFDLGGSTYVSHAARFTYLGKAAITNNDLLNPGNTEASIKLMAPGFPYSLGGLGDTNTCSGHYTDPPGVGGAGCPAVASGGIGGGYTRWVEISDNYFKGASNNYMVTAAPQNQNSDERIKDVVIERNWFVAGGSGTVNTALYLTGFDFTVRNNIFSMVGAHSPSSAIYFIESAGGTISVPPDDLMVYNNSWYSDYPAGNQIEFVRFDSSATNISLVNNLGFSPNSSATCLLFNVTTSTCTPAPANNTSNTQLVSSNPGWQNGSGNYSLVSDFHLNSGSYAIGLGTSSKTWNDFSGLIRTNPYDLGAVNH